ncbi:hypothetical protein PR048_005482 [Dryococelus australis]|uniref:Uncharacterized protein n=1 Tax=Dryococelus australis TaxID=614101 RepID=A0ABQ9I8C7_9NEOP|nr:hypothetical protein PR048_005482 [Dryococelus australis]
MARQQRFAVEMWAGIINDHLIGPYHLPRCLAAPVYREFLQDMLSKSPEDVPHAVREDMWPLVLNEEYLLPRILAACNVSKSSAMLQRIRQNLLRRCDAYIDARSRHFKHLL